MRTPSLAVLIVTLVLGVAGLAGGVWWFGVRPAQQLTATVDRLVSGLAAGELDEADATGPLGDGLGAIYAGMGALRPEIELIGDPRHIEPGRVEVDLAWSWTIHEGRDPWRYSTVVTLLREGDTWRALVRPDSVVPDLIEGQLLRASRVTPVRGSILGESGEPLATNTAAWRLGIDKTTTDLATALSAADHVAGLLGTDAEALRTRVENSGPRAFIEARILRQHDEGDAELMRLATQHIGVRALPTTFPLGRTPTFFRPILGYVGEATAEQVEASGGTIRAGDLAGRGGLQAARNHVLAGTPGFAVSVVVDGATVREEFRVEAIDGTDVITTINTRWQEEAEAQLAGVDSASALVALRVGDGAVLAAASGPGSEGFSTATLGQYAPGSTMKIVTALAMLRAGSTPDSIVTCSDGYVVDGYRFDNWGGYPAAALGSVTLREAFAWSCNSAFLSAAEQLGVGAIADAAESLGLIAEPNLVVGGFLGEVPREGTAVEQAASAIGQGRVVASPLGLASVAASVAAGETRTPFLVHEPARQVAMPATPLTASEAEALRELMRAVVTDGTARGLASLGEGVAAKTGTGSWGAAPVKYHGWVVVIHGDVAVAAFIEDAAGSGAAVALASAFLSGVSG